MFSTLVLSQLSSILGVSIDSSADDIRRAYRKLAMQWHPDRWTRTPSLLGEAKRKFQQIQEAYSVLSDQRKRTLYDMGFYDPDEEEEEDEGFCDFVEEMRSLMAQNKDKSCSTDELQKMLMEMAQGSQFSSWPCGPTVIGDFGYSESLQWNSDLLMGRNPPQFDTSKWQMYGTGSYWR
ncbi:chaperone protein DnaJ-like isoform X2 [Tripterygium wilfordii]|uniref:chaperone protein DnaJ-like isoform X2 n=1 Tax=Tripterygium wilfordii TaxID=458696 RepID=UPI0018F7F417|nr:chaperone protein DnaJ-like isoform X2 [Tripterygium wilfordii]